MNFVIQQLRSSCYGGIRRGMLVLVAACSVLSGASVVQAQAPPAIDGNMDDMIAYAAALQSSGEGCGIDVTDLGMETRVNDLKLIPCPQPQPGLNEYWVNGVEILRHVLAYDVGSTTLFLGMRTDGLIGDVDGNNNPDNACGGSCNPNCNLEDE